MQRRAFCRFIRRARNPEDFVVVVCNFTPVLRLDYRVGVPAAGYYREILNSDSGYYEGSDAGNAGGVRAEPIPWNGSSVVPQAQGPTAGCRVLQTPTRLILRRASLTRLNPPASEFTEHFSAPFRT